MAGVNKHQTCTVQSLYPHFMFTLNPELKSGQLPCVSGGMVWASTHFEHGLPAGGDGGDGEGARRAQGQRQAQQRAHANAQKLQSSRCQSLRFCSCLQLIHACCASGMSCILAGYIHDHPAFGIGCLSQPKCTVQLCFGLLQEHACIMSAASVCKLTIYMTMRASPSSLLRALESSAGGCTAQLACAFEISSWRIGLGRYSSS